MSTNLFAMFEKYNKADQRWHEANLFYKEDGEYYRADLFSNIQSGAIGASYFNDIMLGEAEESRENGTITRQGETTLKTFDRIQSILYNADTGGSIPQGATPTTVAAINAHKVDEYSYVKTGVYTGRDLLELELLCGLLSDDSWAFFKANFEKIANVMRFIIEAQVSKDGDDNPENFRVVLYEA